MTPTPPAPTVRLAAATAPAAAPARDVALDALRGIFIMMMVANHLAPGSLLNRLTHSPLYVDGAQGFVFVSGFVVGMVHRRRVARAGSAGARRAVWGRALQLDAIHVALVGAAVAGCLALDGDLRRLTPPPAVVAFGAGGIATGAALLRDVLLLRWQPPYLDILPLYVLFLALTPPFLGLAERRGAVLPALLLAGLYVAAQVAPTLLEFRHATPDGGHGLVLPAWQLLFFGGALLGWSRGAASPTGGPEAPGLLPGAWSRRVLPPAAALFALLYALAQTRRPAMAGLDLLGEAGERLLLDKSSLAPLRLLYFASAVLLAEAALRALVLAREPVAPGVTGRAGWRRRAGSAAVTLAVFGRASLYCYLIHFAGLAGFRGVGVPGWPWWAQDLLVGAFLLLLYAAAERGWGRRFIPN